ncbi:phosphatidate phosphatase PAH2-like isoform X1 [Cucurbita moschata]|uniref:Phosphatidate phosphatase PAH2-like isoform X1 n=1 Tax=Cucurbita moschata TaxID=3662 RepID=A0A6J1HE20_CUCMO|nr:phosphatidate phosphatase PAH2-like isoform X1 [Cucurbita moschata]XP_022962066.1 phosphatidate phosphatase PAH2-like isoform X1 [Cucurbita moschata]XP_022962067.1 phosphatidate phosphatase PAH2-like isoform X1 [Cucurbita moschata]
MNAVGILGSYISKGVYTVSGPFHPFGGAVDIVVVEQQDGSFKSSPWYVRFGKFQGVLKTKEKVINIAVNGVEANFQMYMDHKGEAYFLREVDAEGESGLYSSSSGDEAEGKLLQELDCRILGSKSYNCDARSSIDGIEKSKDKGKIVTKTTSQRRTLGWGRNSIKEDHHEDASLARVDSLKRAEIVADLLEVRWSTNLRTQKLEKSDCSKFSSIDTSDDKDEEKLRRDDETSHVTSTDEGNMGNSLDKDCENSGSKHITNGSQLESEDVALSTEVTRELSSLNTEDRVIEISTIGGKDFDGTYEMKSAPTDIEQTAKDTVNATGTISENADSESQILLLKNSDSYYGENFIGRHLSDETNIVSQVFNISEDKSECDAVQSLMFYETSKSSMLTMDDSSVLTPKASHPANGGYGIVDVHSEGLHLTTEVHPGYTDSSVVAGDFEIETEKFEALVNYSQQVDHCNSSVYEGNTMDQEKLPTLEASYTQIVSTEEMHGSVKEFKSDSRGSSFGSDFQDDKSVDGSVKSKFQISSNSIGNRVVPKESNIIPSTNSDDEQFLFSDIDVSKAELNGNIELDSQRYNDKEEYPLAYPSSIDEEDRFVNRSCVTSSSPDSHEFFNQGIASSITIPSSRPILNKEFDRMAASLPNMQDRIDNLIAGEISHPLSHSVDSNAKSLKWMEFSKDNAGSKSCRDEEDKVAEERSRSEESSVSEELKGIIPNSRAGSPAEATVDPVGNWKLWPFSFRRSSSRKGTQSAVDDYVDFDIKKTSDRNVRMDGEASIFKHKAEKKMVKSLTPTSEQLASLNLKEGGNTILFTFYTAVLGKQQVDAKIYLWKWNTRVVISDVDGTITKSDVLGQFMPFVGRDWSQTGVTNLFSAIKENGYQLLFLSARSISQAYQTRQFLFNLKQGGKALPEGPVVISPDGLFPSLYREVIRRAPHEFKIECLERIRELFPPDCNPFYAGFGNRDTDEFSYLKVGIPIGKIFIINPKGEIVVNRRFDTKSYTSLHTLVNDMFPPITSSEQEDFNSWNYWKLSPPLVDS